MAEWDRGHPERRSTWRVKVGVAVRVKGASEEENGFSEDLGGGGARFISPRRFEAGEEVEIVIPSFMRSYPFIGTVLDSREVELTRDYRTRVQWIEPDTVMVKNLLGHLYRKHFAAYKR